MHGGSPGGHRGSKASGRVSVDLSATSRRELARRLRPEPHERLPRGEAPDPRCIAAGGGSIIFTSTFVGYTVGFPGVAADASSKAGLIGFPQALAAEFGPQGVRVNALLPGAVDTPIYREMNNTPETQSFVTGLHALKRVSSPEELARSALYLASDASAFTTGTAMLVDGGASINRT